jgi:reactive intermediate/imine deaminase
MLLRAVAIRHHRGRSLAVGGTSPRECSPMIEFLMVPGAPKPVAPFSHATAAAGWLFVTGQMPTDPDDDNAALPEGIEAQTRRVMDNLQLVLAGAGSGLDQVVFARAYLTDFQRDYAAMNCVYQSYFAAGRLPARTCIGVTGLARGALIEIDLLARQGG